MTLAILLLLACQPQTPPVPPNYDRAMASVLASLDEAARLDVASQDEDARTSWRRAHAEFSEVLEPGFREHISSTKVALIEVRFGLFRAALERTRGSSRQELRLLKHALEEAGPALDEPVDPDSDSATAEGSGTAD
ncbi:MAG: hypothetical protein ACJAZO_001823 [Myxococcota bacterium]